MTTIEKLKQLRKDFYNNDSVNYDSIDYFTSIEKDLQYFDDIVYVYEKYKAIDRSQYTPNYITNIFLDSLARNNTMTDIYSLLEEYYKKTHKDGE